MRFPACLVLLTAALGACDDSGTAAFPMQATPAHASMFGEVDVELTGDFSRLGTLSSVSVGGILALNVRATPTVLTLRVQGAPASGPASIVVTGDRGVGTSESAFAYDPPAGGAAPRWSAFGASLTQGFQSAGLNAHGQVVGFAAATARASGAYLGLPLVVDTFLPPMTPAEFVKDCGRTFDVGMIAADVIGSISDPATKRIDFRRARQDATMVTQNFAVGGAKVAAVLQPATGGSSFIERVIELPDGNPTSFGGAVTFSQVDRLVMLDPDVAVSLDLLANDSDSSVTQSDDLHPELATDLPTIQAELTELASRLGGLHGDYFISNLLELDALPNVVDLRAQRIAAGKDTAASFDLKVAKVKALIDAYNAALGSAVAPYPNLHVVDVRTWTATIIRDGVVIGGQRLTGQKFGGLLSLDHLHFTDTGYALAANVFIDAINGAKGWQIPHVDVAAVLAADALSPRALQQAGVMCGGP